MDADAPEIAVGTTRGGLYLGLRGHATQRTCPTANRLVDDYLASGPQPPTVVVDVAGCEWVDSTFAGWLLGLSGRIAPMANGALLVEFVTNEKSGKGHATFYDPETGDEKETEHWN